MIERIISGGQAGVDRAALDVALELSIPCGGWCPKGRRAEDGRIPDRYPLQKTPSRGYRQRTERNVRDSDGTLVLHAGKVGRGTALTIRLAEKLGKPLMVVDQMGEFDQGGTSRWIRDHCIRVLNVAGPRASQGGSVCCQASQYLRAILESVNGLEHSIVSTERDLNRPDRLGWLGRDNPATA